MSIFANGVASLDVLRDSGGTAIDPSRSFSQVSETASFGLVGEDTSYHYLVAGVAPANVAWNIQSFNLQGAFNYELENNPNPQAPQPVDFPDAGVFEWVVLRGVTQLSTIADVSSLLAAVSAAGATWTDMGMRPGTTVAGLLTFRAYHSLPSGTLSRSRLATAAGVIEVGDIIVMRVKKTYSFVSTITGLRNTYRIRQVLPESLMMVAPSNGTSVVRRQLPMDIGFHQFPNPSGALHEPSTIQLRRLFMLYEGVDNVPELSSVDDTGRRHDSLKLRLGDVDEIRAITSLNLTSAVYGSAPNLQHRLTVHAGVVRQGGNILTNPWVIIGSIAAGALISLFSFGLGAPIALFNTARFAATAGAQFAAAGIPQAVYAPVVAGAVQVLVQAGSRALLSGALAAGVGSSTGALVSAAAQQAALTQTSRARRLSEIISRRTLGAFVDVHTDAILLGQVPLSDAVAVAPAVGLFSSLLSLSGATEVAELNRALQQSALTMATLAEVARRTEIEDYDLTGHVGTTTLFNVATLDLSTTDDLVDAWPDAGLLYSTAWHDSQVVAAQLGASESQSQALLDGVPNALPPGLLPYDPNHPDFPGWATAYGNYLTQLKQTVSAASAGSSQRFSQLNTVSLTTHLQAPIYSLDSDGSVMAGANVPNSRLAQVTPASSARYDRLAADLYERFRFVAAPCGVAYQGDDVWLIGTFTDDAPDPEHAGAWGHPLIVRAKAADPLSLPTPVDRRFAIGEPITSFVLPEASGGLTPYRYTLGGDFRRTGLRFDAATRRVYGIPTGATGDFVCEYTVYDSFPNTANSRTVSFTITLYSRPFLPHVGDRTIYLVGTPPTASTVLPPASRVADPNAVLYHLRVAGGVDTLADWGLSFDGSPGARRITATRVVSNGVSLVYGSNSGGEASNEQAFRLTVLDTPPPPTTPFVGSGVRIASGGRVLDNVIECFVTDGLGTLDRTFRALLFGLVAETDIEDSVTIQMGFGDRNTGHNFGLFEVDRVRYLPDDNRTALTGRWRMDDSNLALRAIDQLRGDVGDLGASVQPFLRWNTLLAGDPASPDSLVSLLIDRIGDKPTFAKVSSSLAQYNLNVDLRPDYSLRVVPYTSYSNRVALGLRDIARGAEYGFDWDNGPDTRARAGVARQEIGGRYQKDKDAVPQIEYTQGVSPRPIILQNTFKSRPRALVAIEARAVELARQKAELKLALAPGNPLIRPRTGIDFDAAAATKYRGKAEWLVTSVTHHWSEENGTDTRLVMALAGDAAQPALTTGGQEELTVDYPTLP